MVSVFRTTIFLFCSLVEWRSTHFWFWHMKKKMKEGEREERRGRRYLTLCSCQNLWGSVVVDNKQCKTKREQIHNLNMRYRCTGPENKCQTEEFFFLPIADQPHPHWLWLGTMDNKCRSYFSKSPLLRPIITCSSLPLADFVKEDSKDVRFF